MKVRLTHLAGSSGCILALTMSHAVMGKQKGRGTRGGGIEGEGEGGDLGSPGSAQAECS